MATNSSNHKSFVWKYFNLNKEEQYVCCIMCNSKLTHKSNSTGTMINHLRNKHPAIHAEKYFDHKTQKDVTATVSVLEGLYKTERVFCEDTNITGNLDIPEEHDPIEPQKPISETADATVGLVPEHIAECDQSQRRKRPRVKVPSTDKAETIKIDDEYTAFGQFICHKIRNLPKSLRTTTQHRITTLLSEQKSDEVEYMDESLDDLSCFQSNTNGALSCIRPPEQKKRRRCHQLCTSGNQGVWQLHDPVDAFLLSLAPSLKELSKYSLNLAKSKLFAIVQEFEMAAIMEKDNRSVKVEEDVEFGSLSDN